MTDVHPIAEQGYGQSADTYVRARPDFPSEALDWLTQDLGLGSGKTVIEVGAGTGKFTKLLAQTGADVTAVEPVAAMLKELRQQLPGVRTIQGTAQHIPLPDSSVDAVVCAQSFHWFASAESLAEFRRVLKPGGALGLIWNVRDASVEWVGKLACILATHEGDAPRYDHGEWRHVFPARGFCELRERTIPHVHTGSPERVIVDRVASVSFIAALDDRTRGEVLAEVRALISSTPELANHVQVGFPYLTSVYWCRRSDTLAT